MNLPNNPQQLERMFNTVPQSSEDAYPKIIADQREMYGKPFRDAKEVDSFQDELAAKRGVKIVVDKTKRSVTPIINHSRWMARCPDCNGGLECWDHNPSTACVDCGLRFKVKWPTPDLCAAIVRALALREDPTMRNWNPETETLADIEAENSFLIKIGAIQKNRKQIEIATRIPDAIATPNQYLNKIEIDAAAWNRKGQ